MKLIPCRFCGKLPDENLPNKEMTVCENSGCPIAGTHMKRTAWNKPQQHVIEALQAAQMAIACVRHIYDKYANSSWQAGLSKDLGVVMDKLKILQGK